MELHHHPTIARIIPRRALTLYYRGKIVRTNIYEDDDDFGFEVTAPGSIMESNVEKACAQAGL